jgi:prophage antirepressor-like protein
MTDILNLDDLYTVYDGQEVWFIGNDICGLIGVNKSQLRRLDSDEKMRSKEKHQTKGGKQYITMINESGLYHLVLTSKSPTAKKFRKLITRDFLPKIREFYGYKPENIAKFIEDSGNKKLSHFEKRALNAIMSND